MSVLKQLDLRIKHDRTFVGEASLASAALPEFLLGAERKHVSCFTKTALSVARKPAGLSV